MQPRGRQPIECVRFGRAGIHVYKLRRSDEVVATGLLNDPRSFEVGDEVEIVEWTGIVRDKLPTAVPSRLRLIVQVD